LTRSDAALFVAGPLSWPWKAARVMRVVPQAVRDRAYDLVARNRYRLFERLDRCLIPSRAFRNRFID
jgi:predicted DCC family thiol-disulfide oxidoreductase YuxK